jgi:hypothetical protein
MVIDVLQLFCKTYFVVCFTYVIITLEIRQLVLIFSLFIWPGTTHTYIKTILISLSLLFFFFFFFFKQSINYF